MNLSVQHSFISNSDNTRIFFSDLDGDGQISLNAQDGEVMQVLAYYPFGMTIEGLNPADLSDPAYRYRYNGKEEEPNTRMYDYGARWYMPDIGRWGVVDPLAEQMPEWSPYNYTFNNPLAYIDPDGRSPVRVVVGAIRIGHRAFKLRRAGEGGIRDAIRAEKNAIVHDAKTLFGKDATIGQRVGAVVDLIIGTDFNEIGGSVDVPLEDVTTNIESNQGSGQGRGKNNRQPDDEAIGDHSVINDRGATSFQKNENSPHGWQETSHIDTKGKDHQNKKTGEKIPVPHRQGRDIEGKKIPGGVERVINPPRYTPPGS